MERGRQEWAFGVEESIGVFEVKRRVPQVFSEFGEQAEWGSAIYATDMVSIFKGRQTSCHANAAAM